MANITISDLRPAGFDLFADPENYVSELSDNELGTINGGVTSPVTPYTPYTPNAAAVAEGAIISAIKVSNPLNSI